MSDEINVTENDFHFTIKLLLNDKKCVTMATSHTDKLSTEKLTQQYNDSTCYTDRKFTEFWEVYSYVVISYIMQRPPLKSVWYKREKTHEYACTKYDEYSNLSI